MAHVRRVLFDPLEPGQVEQLGAAAARVLEVLDPEARFAATAMARDLAD